MPTDFVTTPPKPGSPDEERWAKRWRPLINKCIRITLSGGGFMPYHFTWGDLVSEGNIALVRAMRSYSGVGKFEAWAAIKIVGALGHICRKRRRDKAHMQGDLQRPLQLMEDEEQLRYISALIDHAQFQRSEELKQMLMGLPPRERHVITEHLIVGRFLREIGESMGISESRAFQLERKGLERLRQAESSADAAASLISI